jgi:predicted membrane metal-binding protein
MPQMQRRFVQRRQQPRPPEPKYRFRWSVFVGVPLVICALLFVLNGIEPSFQFEDIMYSLRVMQEERYVRLACLGVVCIAVILIVKLFKNHPR